MGDEDTSVSYKYFMMACDSLICAVRCLLTLAVSVTLLPFEDFANILHSFHLCKNIFPSSFHSFDHSINNTGTFFDSLL